MSEHGVIDDPHYTTPLDHKAEAAHSSRPSGTWAAGYARKRFDGSQLISAAMVTTLDPVWRRGLLPLIDHDGERSSRPTRRKAVLPSPQRESNCGAGGSAGLITAASASAWPEHGRSGVPRLWNSVGI